MRPDRDPYFMKMAALIASRSTCLRRSVGCVLVNERHHVLATGYNGVAAGLSHCNEPTEKFLDGTPKLYGNSCEGVKSPSGQGLDQCQAVHAEQNALLQCRNAYEIHTCYTTTLPCITCMKLLMNTSCQRIVFGMSYPHKEVVEDLASKRGIELVFHVGTP